MNKDQEKQIVIGAAVLGAAIIGYTIYKTSKRKKDNQAKQIEDQKNESQKPENQPAQQVPNISKKLKLGSRGTEVRKLQMLLGFKGKNVDGVFGSQTERALQDQQGVNELNLDEFKANVNNKPTNSKVGILPSTATPPIATNMKPAPKKKDTPAIGTKLMAIKNRIGLFTAEKLVNGRFRNTGRIGKRVAYGQNAGIYIGVHPNGNQWLVKSDDKIFYTDAENVNPY